MIRLRNYRIARNRTQLWLAHQVGVHINTIHRWERGLTLGHPKLPVLAAALDCTVAELMRRAAKRSGRPGP